METKKPRVTRLLWSTKSYEVRLRKIGKKIMNKSKTILIVYKHLSFFPAAIINMVDLVVYKTTTPWQSQRGLV